MNARSLKRSIAKTAASVGRGLARGLSEATFAVAPDLWNRRQTARQVRTLQERRFGSLMAHFEGADKDRLRGDSWMRSRLSPDSATEQSLEELRENCRELYCNFGWTTGAIEHRVDNVIGCGIRPQSRIREWPGVITAAQAKTFNSENEENFKRWSPYAGRNRKSLWRIQRLAQRLFRRDGEVFLVFSDIGRVDKPVPLDVSVVAAERVETPPEKAGDPLVRLGIQFTKQGDIEGYWIRETHPYDTVDNTPRYKFYPEWRVRHVFEELFEGQHRGWPWLFSVITDAKDFKDFKEAVVIAAQVHACITMLVSTDNPAAAAITRPDEEMSPGKILYRRDADQVHTLQPTQPSTTFDMFGQWNMLGISAGLNYPFGWLVRDRRRATFSAGRLDEIDGKIPLRCDQELHRDIWLNPLWERFVSESVVLGESSIDPTLYRKYPWIFNACRWVGPGRPWIDPTKEVAAAKEAKNENMATLTEILAGVGLDLEETLETRAYERQLEEELGVVPPDSAAMATAPEDPDENDTADENEEAHA